MYKVAIIGSGVIGSMIAMELSKYDKNIVVLEKENDCAMGQSKANSGIVHAGYDPLPGTLKAKLNVEGSQMMPEICKKLQVKYRNNGAFVLGFNDDDKEVINKLYDRGLKNGVKGLSVIDGDDARKSEKNLSNAVKWALKVESSAIVCPYELTIHALGLAMDNGADFITNFEVSDIKDNGKYFEIYCKCGKVVEAEYVINCAGVYSDKIAKLVGDDSFSITPRKGEYFLLDKDAKELCDMTIFRVPSKMGKGVLASPTVDNNIILGPTSVDIDDKENKEVTPSGLAFIKEREMEFFDKVPWDKQITEFTGLRAHSTSDDFIINSPKKRFINCAGIESPGLTASPAIAVYVRKMLNDMGEFNGEVIGLDHLENRINFKLLSQEEKNELIIKRPEFGHIVCRCEEVTEGEIIEAIRNNPKATDIDAIKRRTRAGMGRCQSGFCMPLVIDILSRELKKDKNEITKKGKESKVTFSKTKKGGNVVSQIFDVVVVGGGPGGMAAAIKAKEAGAINVLIVERDDKLGGILEQCIHNGFGLHKFKEELTGPEYAERFERMVKANDIQSLTNAIVTEIKQGNDLHSVTIMNCDMGYITLKTHAIVLAMGCREKARGTLAIPGERPAGIFSAGTAQKLVNIEGNMPGHNVVILGSGDIGLIMARRMSLEGANVKAVCEIMKDSGGLTRNIVQCLNDFNIPLHLQTTVVDIKGRERLEGVTIAKVDDHFTPIKGTEEYIPCDTLLLSVGLVPENELTRKAGIEMDPKTRGPLIDYNCQTKVPGIFACGNVCKVHELVDFVSDQGDIAGFAAGCYALGKELPSEEVVLEKHRKQVEQKKGVSNLSKPGENAVICTTCPNGCRIVVDKNEKGEFAFTGNLCKRGEVYAANEMTLPKRVITSTVMAFGGVIVPVKSDKPIDKTKLMDVMEEINNVSLMLPIKQGSIIIKNVAGTDANIICAKTF